MAPTSTTTPERKKRTVAEALQDNTWIDNIRYNLTTVLVAEFFKDNLGRHSDKARHPSAMATELAPDGNPGGLERNSRVFGNLETPPHRIIDKVTDEIWLWCAGGAKGIQCLTANNYGSANDSV
uniref:Uncharacterized protein n=1 Tax=Oryza sativa subsp. japonica TaxID=39947 RepID=Q6Z1I9_ORYSJ|nr:hypothetical protein [Oryza sativa Japonica Group]BAD03583.1 hypothetical protein [Oryza sativa Japonica Group]